MRPSSIKKILRVFIFVTIISSLIIGCAKNDDPATPDRDKFIGTWHVSAHGSQSGDQFWDMTISASNSSAEQILITNFDLQRGTTTIAGVSGNNFSISSQHIGGVTVQGSGSYSGGSLTFHYTSTDTQTDDVNATAKK